MVNIAFFTYGYCCLMSSQPASLGPDDDSGSQSAKFDEEMDSLHILPLSIIPLTLKGLKSARLIKNSKLQGVVELFSDRDTGSGQIEPSELDKVFEFGEENKQDLRIIENLCKLSSYDVYSLRIELRNLGIEVNKETALKLSDKMASELSEYMREFTRPLIKGVYGGSDKKAEDISDIIKLFASPDRGTALENLHKISETLNVEFTEIPIFLENYGDVFLSLSYYESHLDKNAPRIQKFLDIIKELQSSNSLKGRNNTLSAIRQIEKSFGTLSAEVADTLEVFKIRTAGMWENISAEHFDEMKQLINTYQTRIGGALCAMTVKMDAWARKFSGERKESHNRYADFIMAEIRPGLETMKPINYSDAAA